MNLKRIGDYIDYDFHTPNTEEVREFLEKEFYYAERQFLKGDEYITPSEGLDYVFTTSQKYNKFISTEDFKQLVGMVKKADFTKSSLKDGMIVTTRNGNVYTVKGVRLLGKGGSTIYLENFNEGLICYPKHGYGNAEEFDIISVQQTVTLFKRETEAELKQQRIAKELEFAEAKRERLNAHIERLKKNLQS